ncbi:hypothetical protein K501DRAFT_271992 [Backusella circina FSU 941]|nr:hypothetical protein K501DRAFT_271992 [Backusella circina FSU 941]
MSQSFLSILIDDFVRTSYSTVTRAVRKIFQNRYQKFWAITKGKLKCHKLLTEDRIAEDKISRHEGTIIFGLVPSIFWKVTFIFWLRTFNVLKVTKFTVLTLEVFDKNISKYDYISNKCLMNIKEFLFKTVSISQNQHSGIEDLN